MGIRDGVSSRRKEQEKSQSQQHHSHPSQNVLSQDDLQDEATFHHEDALDDAFDRQVTEGRQRLARPRPQQFVTGFMGGIEIGLGVLIGMSVTHDTGSMLLGGLAFSLGFVTLLLAHSELFTEGFLVPTFAVIAHRAKLIQLVRFWCYTFLGNLVGGLAVMWVVVQAFPSIHSTLDNFGGHFAGLQPRLDTVLLAILAGVSITLMTRMQMGTDQVIGKIAAAVFGGILLFGVGMLHSVLDTLIMFGAWFAGASEVNLLSILNFLWWVIPLNMLGGIVGVALPRAIQARDRIRIERLRVMRELLTGVEYADDARGALMTGSEVREDLEKDLYILQEDEPEPETNAWEELGSRISKGFNRLGNLSNLGKIGKLCYSRNARPIENELTSRRFPWKLNHSSTEETSITSVTVGEGDSASSPAVGNSIATSLSVSEADTVDNIPTPSTSTQNGEKEKAKDAQKAAQRAEREECEAAKRAKKEAEEAFREQKKTERRAQRATERAAKEATKSAHRAKKEALKRAAKAAKRAAKDTHKTKN